MMFWFVTREVTALALCSDTGPRALGVGERTHHVMRQQCHNSTSCWNYPFLTLTDSHYGILIAGILIIKIALQRTSITMAPNLLLKYSMVNAQNTILWEWLTLYRPKHSSYQHRSMTTQTDHRVGSPVINNDKTYMYNFQQRLHWTLN